MWICREALPQLLELANLPLTRIWTVAHVEQVQNGVSRRTQNCWLPLAMDGNLELGKVDLDFPSGQLCRAHQSRAFCHPAILRSVIHDGNANPRSVVIDLDGIDERLCAQNWGPCTKAKHLFMVCLVERHPFLAHELLEVVVPVSTGHCCSAPCVRGQDVGVVRFIVLLQDVRHSLVHCHCAMHSRVVQHLSKLAVSAACPLGIRVCSPQQSFERVRATFLFSCRQVRCLRWYHAPFSVLRRLVELLPELFHALLPNSNRHRGFHVRRLLHVLLS